MANLTPKQQILDFLASGAVTCRTSIPFADRHKPIDGETLKKSLIYANVNMDTVEFVREKTVANRQMHIITCESVDSYKFWFDFYFVQDEAGNWLMRGGGVGGALYELRKYNETNLPKLNIGGTLGRSSFYLVGYIDDKGYNITKILAKDGNGLVIEDTIQDETVILITDQTVIKPLILELYDGNDQLVATRDMFS